MAEILESVRIALFIATFGLLAHAQSASPLPRTDRGFLTRPPAVLHSIDAAYPPSARAEGLTGTVRLQLDISETGQVSQVSVLEPAGHGFDQAAVEAVRQFTFSPAEVDGKPTAVRVTYDYHFVLDQAPPALLTQKPDRRAINFTGQIRRRGNRKPLSAAVVSLPGLSRSAITDENGGFSFSGIPNGKVSVVVVAPGYERFETDEQIEPGGMTRASYYLKQLSSFELETVVRGDRDRKEVTRTTLSADEVQRVPGTNGDSLKVVQNLPGVARARFNGG
ncbi:MAG TPA: TonB family protein, partial [Myxococcales bacterium]